MMLLGKLVRCKQDGKTNKKKATFTAQISCKKKKKKKNKSELFLTDFIFIISFCLIIY